MICAKGQRALRSGKQDYSDRCWGKVFCVPELEESVCLCVRHYEKLREINEASCCFPQSSVSDICSGRLTKCPQRLVTVFETLVKGTDKLFINSHICNKHLSQADTEERILCSKNYTPPRKVRSKLTFVRVDFKINCTLQWDLNFALKLVCNSDELQSTQTIHIAKKKSGTIYFQKFKNSRKRMND